MVRIFRKAKFEAIANAAIDLVPNWYIAESGPYMSSVDIEKYQFEFCALDKPTEKLNWLHGEINSGITRICQESEELKHPLFREMIQERFVKKWLFHHAPEINWDNLIAYFHELSRRTYENHPVTVNLVLRNEISRTGRRLDIVKKRQKFFDQLATSSFTYFHVDKNLKLIGLKEVQWNEVESTGKYKFMPEFLYPFHCAMNKGEFSAHLTSAGDWIFMDKQGILATRRKNSWKIYDKPSFKRTISKSITSFNVGRNLFEIAFDLSFKRHGALLVFDPQKKVKFDPESRLVASRKSDTGQALVAKSVREIQLGNPRKNVAKKRILTELASIDGAVIYDRRKLLAVGALIETHTKAKGESGARSTAALSAYHWGGHPLKVSSDGDVAIYFKSDDACDAKIEFL